VSSATVANGDSRSDRWYEVGLIACLLGVAVLVRIVALPYVSRDYTGFLSVWYEYIDVHGGFAALRDTFSNYNVPYLYLLATLTYLPVPALTGIKLVSVLFDLVLAYYVYRIVRLRYSATWVAGLAAVTVLLLPTVWLNSAMWAQADSIYSAFCVAGVYYLLRRRPWLACLLIGSAFAFKLQTVFILPVLVTLAVVRYLPWRTLLAVPAAYVAWALPAMLLGHSMRHLFLVYLDQAESDQRLTANAPSVYQFFRIENGVQPLRQAGIVFTAGLVLLVILLVLKSRREIDGDRLLLLALLFAILVPFFLPAMHERYFYLADVLSIAVAFWMPRLLWVPLLVQIASLLSYVAFLFGAGREYGVSVDQRVPAVLMFAALVLVVRAFGQEFGLRSLLTQARRDAAQADAAPTPAPNGRHRPAEGTEEPTPVRHH
jgi:Gpi18-like mannosyltransferase